MQSRPRFVHMALLVAAVAAPALYLLGLTRYGRAVLYLDFGRLVVIYLALAVGAAAATYLSCHRGHRLVRLAAGLSLLANLSGIAYAELLWRPDMERSMAEIERRLFESNQTGILVAAASDAPLALQEARTIEESVQRIFTQSGVGSIVVRPSQPIASEDQARSIGRDLGANLVVWVSSEQTGERITDAFHVTVLGASARGMAVDAVPLLVSSITQGTLTVSRTRYGESDASLSVVEGVLIPAVTGLGFLAENHPLLAATQFQTASEYAGLDAMTQSTLLNYLGTTLLVAGRPDLAGQPFTKSNTTLSNAGACVGLGTVAVAGSQWDQAQEAFSRAVALDPYDPGAYCGIGYVQATRRDIHNAYIAYQQAIALNPEYGVPYVFMALLYELRADVPSAQRAYQEAAARVRFDKGMHAAIAGRSEHIRQNPPTPVPTATPKPVPTTTPIPTSALHIVAQGDSLKAIADKYGVSISEIVEINTLEDPDALYIGQILMIPPLPDD